MLSKCFWRQNNVKLTGEILEATAHFLHVVTHTFPFAKCLSPWDDSFFVFVRDSLHAFPQSHFWCRGQKIPSLLCSMSVVSEDCVSYFWNATCLSSLVWICQGFVSSYFWTFLDSVLRSEPLVAKNCTFKRDIISSMMFFANSVESGTNFWQNVPISCVIRLFGFW